MNTHLRFIGSYGFISQLKKTISSPLTKMIELTKVSILMNLELDFGWLPVEQFLIYQARLCLVQLLSGALVNAVIIGSSAGQVFLYGKLVNHFYSFQFEVVLLRVQVEGKRIFTLVQVVE